MIAALLLFALLAPPPSDDPHRQFDFWVGEWSVQNRHMGADGSWSEGDVTRARITPVCGGKAVLEEWAGPFRGTFMNGFSLRAWDEREGRWTLLLNWTTDGNGSFGPDERVRVGQTRGEDPSTAPISMAALGAGPPAPAAAPLCGQQRRVKVRGAPGCKTGGQLRRRRAPAMEAPPAGLGLPAAWLELLRD